MRLIFSLGFLRPNQRDLAAVRLPKGLHGLYYLIRPFRILMGPIGAVSSLPDEMRALIHDFFMSSEADGNRS